MKVIIVNKATTILNQPINDEGLECYLEELKSYGVGFCVKELPEGATAFTIYDQKITLDEATMASCLDVITDSFRIDFMRPIFTPCVGVSLYTHLYSFEQEDQLQSED